VALIRIERMEYNPINGEVKGIFSCLCRSPLSKSADGCDKGGHDVFPVIMTGKPEDRACGSTPAPEAGSPGQAR
jgi:hypothetical protein